MSMEYGYEPQYGYQDYTSASNEAYQLSWEAYNAGDMDASDYWSTQSWSNWSTGTDLYVSGADAYGTDSPSTSEGYYGDYSYEMPTPETPSVDDYYSSSTDYSASDYSSTATDYSSDYYSTATDYSSDYYATDYSSSYDSSSYYDTSGYDTSSSYDSSSYYDSSSSYDSSYDSSSYDTGSDY